MIGDTLNPIKDGSIKPKFRIDSYSIVIQLVLDTKVSEGFTKLALEGRLDLSVEAVVIEEPWSELFDDETVKAAKAKLGLD